MARRRKTTGEDFNQRLLEHHDFRIVQFGELLRPDGHVTALKIDADTKADLLSALAATHDTVSQIEPVEATENDYDADEG